MHHAAPHRCCFCLKPRKKTLSWKDSCPASLPFCIHFVVWSFLGCRHQSSTCKVLALLGWKLYPLRSWYPNNVPFLLPRTENLAVALCLLGFCLLLKTSLSRILRWLDGFSCGNHICDMHRIVPILTPNRKEATRIEVVFNLSDINNFVADGLPVRSSNGVLRIGCWFADCELCP